MPPAAPPKRDAPATTWLLFVLVLAAIGGIGYFAFYDTGREADRNRVPIAVSQTETKAVETAVPSPRPVPSVSAKRQ